MWRVVAALGEGRAMLDQGESSHISNDPGSLDLNPQRPPQMALSANSLTGGPDETQSWRRGWRAGRSAESPSLPATL